MTRITARYDDLALRSADAVMVMNPWMLDYARRAVTGLSTKVMYAPPGVDAQLFRPADPRGAKDGYILAVGRFSDPRKNGILLLEMLARLRNRRAHLPRLILVSPDDPGMHFWVKADALQLRHGVSVRLHPKDLELAELYRNALCLVLSSNEEGFGMVVVEAMASGVPVVATRCGGPEGIITDGQDGFLVRSGDPDSMSERVAVLLDDRKRNLAMGRRARSTVEARYAENVAGQAFLEVYRSLLDEADKTAGPSCAA